jgi:hypothetical protein
MTTNSNIQRLASALSESAIDVAIKERDYKAAVVVNEFIKAQIVAAIENKDEPIAPTTQAN